MVRCWSVLGLFIPDTADAKHYGLLTSRARYMGVTDGGAEIFNVPHHQNILPSDNMSRFSTPSSQAYSPNTSERTHSSPQNNRITIKNRRKKYLDSHPAYFLSPSLELAGLFCLHITCTTYSLEFELMNHHRK